MACCFSRFGLIGPGFLNKRFSINDDDNMFGKDIFDDGLLLNVETLKGFHTF